MSSRRFTKFAAVTCVALAAWTVAATPAFAAGYYNLPGSFCQCFGYGNGAGYHACLVLGPLSCRGFCTTHEVRLDCPPQPPYGYYGNARCGSSMGGTLLEEPVPTPTPAASGTAPESSAARRQVSARPRFW